MDLASLQAELTGGHPGTGAYSADDATAADEINAVNRTRNRTNMSGSEVINAVDSGEFTALDATNKQMVWDIVHLGNVNPFGIEATLFTTIFGGGSATITSLMAARTENISRATELELGNVKAGHVQRARS